MHEKLSKIMLVIPVALVQISFLYKAKDLRTFYQGPAICRRNDGGSIPKLSQNFITNLHD